MFYVSPGNLGKIFTHFDEHAYFFQMGRGKTITNQISYLSSADRLISSTTTSGRRFLGGELGGPKSLQSVAPKGVVAAVRCVFFFFSGTVLSKVSPKNRRIRVFFAGLPKGNSVVCFLVWTETGCRWRCETRRPRFATQSSDAFILNARAHCLALQMIFFSSPPQGSDDFCKVLRKQLVTQLNCGNHASCKEPRNTTRCSFYRGGRNKN